MKERLRSLLKVFVLVDHLGAGIGLTLSARPPRSPSQGASMPPLRLKNRVRSRPHEAQ
jgi:hypothetical protein